MMWHRPSHRLVAFRARRVVFATSNSLMLLVLVLVAMTPSLRCHPTSFANAFAIVNHRHTPPRTTKGLHNGNCLGDFRSREMRFTSQLFAKPDDDDDENDDIVVGFVMERWNKADFLEIRLDTTLASCHVLAQYLVFDMSLPKKDIPGFEVEDVIMLANLFSSVAVLAILWTASGLITRVFEERGFDPVRLIATTLLAGPSWLAICIAFRWAPVGIIVDPSMMGSIGTAVVVGCLGLCATLSLGRIVSANIL
jgi:hypothetical protein